MKDSKQNGDIFISITDQATYSFLDATVYCGNVDDKVSEALLWELFLQAGPVGKFYPIYSAFKFGKWFGNLHQMFFLIYFGYFIF